MDMNCAEGCDCLPITNKFGPESEQYPVTLDGNNVSYVCKLISGEVWTVIQRRINGVIDFHSKLWTEYEAGFGSNSNEFWIGLKEIHRLTSVGLTKIRINLGFEDGSDGYAQYSHFTVGGTDTDYMLTISGYSGTAGDMMITTDSDVNLNGMKFSTIDRDNDHYSSGSCAAYYKGAWWFKYCTLSNLNALYNDFNNFAWGP
ncbi:fibrinogen-like protein A, partial [Saccostrea cucullata]|uniref:fibrinogen-like protein A n=1 Tax=Saccostrea cuccullata TaxID=36930 RepID=UPI002ED2677B